MLRTCTPGPAPHLRSPSPTQGLRRQIVDMVRITDTKEVTDSPTIIYDLRLRKVVQEKTTRHSNTPPDIRRIPAKTRQSPYSPDLSPSKSSGSFPPPKQTSTPLVQRREWRRVSPLRQASPTRSRTTLHTPTPPRHSQGSPETTKRPRTGQHRANPRPKSIRLNNDSGPHHSESSSPSDEKTISKTSGEPCEVRGNAITTSPNKPRIMSPVKRAEVQRRATLFSASLEMFRRRLKMNHNKLFGCNKVNTDDYVIRKDEESKSSSKKKISANKVPHPPKNPPNGPVAKTQPEDSGDESHDTRGTRCSYKVPNVPEEEKKMSLSDLRALPQVHTYVLEDDSTEQVRRRSFKEPAPLTSHNLSIHNMFMEQQRRRPRVESNGIVYDPRVMRWVEESNAQGRVQRVVRFNISNSSLDKVAVQDPSKMVPS